MGDVSKEDIYTMEGSPPELLDLDWFNIITQSSTADTPEQTESQHSPDSSTKPEERRSPPPPPMLPPCRICGDKASGFHYGVNTCEACKGFYRRALKWKKVPGCVGAGGCDITSTTRSVCGHCRWRKCIDSGMSKSAIKTGRYTHRKRSEDTLEVQRLKRAAQRKNAGRCADGLTDVQDWSELERVVTHIIDVHKKHTLHTPEFFDQLPLRENQFLEERQLKEKRYGSLPPLPNAEYKHILNTTGMDLDGRRDMINNMIPCIEQSIKRLITFAKALPGFKQLPVADKIALIKASHNECRNIWRHRTINLEKNTCVAPNGDIQALSEVRQICGSLTELKLRNIKLLHRLELTYDETVLLGCLAILAPDRVSEASRDAVERAQWLVTQGLYGLLSRNHAAPGVTLGHCMRVLAEERAVSLALRENEEQFWMEWGDQIAWPALFVEIIM